MPRPLSLITFDLFGTAGLKQMGISIGPLIRDYLETKAAIERDGKAQGHPMEYDMAS
ncbi:MAG: hypothetical protein PVG41_18305 [Desulfobacteraceae bacterium]|jgi:hypothetical protein